MELFEKDLEYMATELNDVSAADTTPISLYEYFHISPIKVCTVYSVYVGNAIINPNFIFSAMIAQVI